MADDNCSVETYSIQFQAKESANQSNRVVRILSNDDLTLTMWSFSAPIHILLSLTRALAPSLPPSTQSINQSFIHSLTYQFRPSLINSHTSSFSHSLS